MKRCIRCVYPSTKPDLHIDEEGVCSACRAFERRSSVDWEVRKRALLAILNAHRVIKKTQYDCIVPVSGGKDSTWQTLKILEFGYRPLLVNAATDYLSELGRRNLDNLKQYADLIEWTPNLEVRRKVARIGLFEIGDMSYGEHCVIWGIPFRVAVAFGIKLIVFGENAQNEYGGPQGSDSAERLDRRWREEFGGLLGLRPFDLVGRDGLTGEDLVPYTMPKEADEVQAIWLGQYLEWNGAANAIYAQVFGFHWMPLAVEGSIGGYEDLDNYVTGPRDFLKFCKYGYGRATDIACNLIRRGMLSREEALRILPRRERFPSSYLAKPLAEILAPFDVTVEQFIEVCDRFTNRSIFTDRKDSDGTPLMRA